MRQWKKYFLSRTITSLRREMLNSDAHNLIYLHYQGRICIEMINKSIIARDFCLFLSICLHRLRSKQTESLQTRNEINENQRRFLNSDVNTMDFVRIEKSGATGWNVLIFLGFCRSYLYVQNLLL